MSMQHLKTEDMIKLIYAQKLDDELLALAARVNQHLYQCEECLERYNTILSIKDISEDAGRENINVFEKKDLALYYNKNLCKENDYVLLLDEMNEVRYAEQIKQYDDNRMVASFKDVLPNSYYAVLAPRSKKGLPKLALEL